MTEGTDTLSEMDNSIRGARAEARREKIVIAARTLFEERGFHGTSMSKLSARSGVLVGQIYRDFANKEAIVAAIVERDLKEFLLDDALREACTRRDTGVVRAWIRRFIAGHQVEDARLIAEIMAESRRNPRVEAIFLEIDARLRALIIRALSVLFPAPDAADDLASLADTIVTLSAGVFYRTIAISSTLDPSVIDALTGCVDREIDALERRHGTISPCDYSPQAPSI